MRGDHRLGSRPIPKDSDVASYDYTDDYTDDDEVGDPVGSSLRPPNGAHYQPNRPYWDTADADADVLMTDPDTDTASEVDTSDPDVAVNLNSAHRDGAAAWLARRKAEYRREHGRDIPTMELREAFVEHLARKRDAVRKDGAVGTPAAAPTTQQEGALHKGGGRTRIGRVELWRMVRRFREEKEAVERRGRRWRAGFWVVLIVLLGVGMGVLWLLGQVEELRWRVEGCEDGEEWVWME